ncbi:hypothetical protein FSP39_021124 [Pinctada imbricata]|uniref:Uncharacterized protein n=1 Tax=Pinctada imbricata TaxID=66713 RepID=A0AA88XWL5_PINIB|nr:hypothetical protein FSP39_021124 [Pinctada imbricata]
MAIGGSRFAQTTEEDRDLKRIKLNSDKTLMANKTVAKVFKEYLSEIGETVEYEQFHDLKLDECLGHFYMDLRKGDGSYYNANSLESIRHGINQHLKCPPFNRKTDIIKDSAFTDSKTCFKAVLAETKRIGKGDVEHYPIITEADLQTLYTSTYLSITTSQGLLNKVQFDVRMFFCHRGNQNMHRMTTFISVFTDENSGRKFVEKVVDEATKNHRLDKEYSSGIMPELRGQ